jgi:hypothetical protein
MTPLRKSWRKPRRAKVRTSRQALFCKKAPQKTFILGALRVAHPCPQDKSFLVLFFKKEPHLFQSFFNLSPR